MARMNCRCGMYLSNHEAPNDIQLIVYTDREWEKIFDCENIQPWMIQRPQYDVWRCPACKRIYVFEENSDVPIMVYHLDS